MSILSDSAIRAAMKAGDIVIDPFDDKRLGSNSYDVALAQTMTTYVQMRSRVDEGGRGGVLRNLPLDSRQDNKLTYHNIPTDGTVLHPGTLYLGATQEYTETHRHVASLDGKSSIGRLGISIHVTAGRGDVGFCGHWTMEIFVVQPVRVYAGMPIGQLTYFAVEGEVERPYGSKGDQKYQHGKQDDPLPQGSKMWRNFR